MSKFVGLGAGAVLHYSVLAHVALKINKKWVGIAGMGKMHKVKKE